MWYFNDALFDEVIEEFDSFVYIIERLNILEDENSPIFYIGKKIFFSKSKYKNKRIINESDWWDYYGSSEWLSNDIKKYGKENFKRTILHLCRTRGDSGYLEAKEQMERNVLHIDENGFKLYYNKNILGRYRSEPEFYIIEEDIKNYFNEYGGNNKNKVWITNSCQNRIVDKKIAEELTQNNIWAYGRCEKHLLVNDGVENFTIPKSSFNNEIHKLGHLKKYITNGIKDKFMSIDKINDFLTNNNNWYIGYSKNNNDIWITNGKEDKKIKKDLLETYIGFYPGRTKIGVKNKICINKDNEIKWINKIDLNEFLKKSWKEGTGRETFKMFKVTNEFNQRQFRSEIEKNEFLANNLDWRDGQIHRESFNTKNKVFARDMRTDERVTVSPEEYLSNRYLTSIKAKKVKIKMKNRIIFNGYLDLFLIENPEYPKSVFMNALKGNGQINLIKGKNTWLNDLMLSISLI